MSDRIRSRHVDLVSPHQHQQQPHSPLLHHHPNQHPALPQHQHQQQQQSRCLREAGRLTQQQRESMMNANLWKAYLYELQQQSPTPKRVVSQKQASNPNKPSYYGREFHGRMSREEGDKALKEQPEDGRYLVRESVRCPGQYTLSLRFNNITKNYRLHFYDGKHFFAADKKFDTLHDLVADALISLYLELHAGDYIASLGNHIKYEESPYMTILKKHRTLRLKNGLLTPAVKSNHDQDQRIISVGQIGGQPLRVKMPAMNPATKPVVPPAPKLSQLSSSANKLISTPGQTPKKLNRFDGLRISSFHEDVDHNARDDTLEDEEEHDYDELDVQMFEKEHNFKIHNFIGLPFCEFCGNFMWGIIGQGVKCEDCGFSAHRKCSEKVPPDCCPDLSHITRVFGVDLTTLVKACNTMRPFVVEACINEIENRGLHVEGLYRVSGFADDVEALKIRLEADGEVAAEFILRACDDVHVITGVLKMYFRLLPIPVITYDSYPYFMAAVKKTSDQEKMNGMRDAISKLLPAHYQVLKYFVQHLLRVAAMSDENLMTAYNLSTVFCPTLMRTPNLNLLPHNVSVWQQEGEVIELMINHYGKLFK